MKNTKLKKLYLLRAEALLLATLCSTTLLTGCSKKADCNIKDNHTHVYVNEEGYVRDINSEKLRVDGYDRTENYDLYDNQELVDFITKKDLLRIDDNIDLINQVQNNNHDYIEYRYAYTTLMPIIHHSGKVTYTTFIPITHHSWTSDANHSRLTGETRICHHVYVGYKIERNEKGKYILLQSEEVDDINTIKDEYPYINKKYCRIVNLENNEVIDYEDGPAEEDPHYQPEEDIEEEQKLTLDK